VGPQWASIGNLFCRILLPLSDWCLNIRNRTPIFSQIKIRLNFIPAYKSVCRSHTYTCCISVY
jgi:hypothetical protein